jgi:hypothetical protein
MEEKMPSHMSIEYGENNGLPYVWVSILEDILEK